MNQLLLNVITTIRFIQKHFSVASNLTIFTIDVSLEYFYFFNKILTRILTLIFIFIKRNVSYLELIPLMSFKIFIHILKNI